MEMSMKKLMTILCLMSMTSAFAADPAPAAAAPAAAKPIMHRYLIERTFPAGALKGLDSATKAKVNTGNKSVGVRWIKSFANADETKTFCLYEGPSEAAVRKAAELNNLPVDSIMEVPVTLLPR
jgi:hypothetical protein